MDAQATSPTLSLTALPVDVAARVLTAAGGEAVPSEWLVADIAAGAPTNGDGTLNLVHYAAWLVREGSRAD